MASEPLPRRLVLVSNPHSGHVRDRLARVHAALAREGLSLLETVPMDNLDRLRDWIGQAEGERPLIVVAGGDGSVGAVANYVVGTSAALGILPFGTSNDIARSLGLPLHIEEAVHLLATGKVSTIDVGRFFAQAEEPRYFVHAATIGINVTFARLATQVTLRRRLGRLTYLVAALAAIRRRTPFTCTLELGSRSVTLCLRHLSVMNAPIFGGRFSFRVEGSDVDDRRLDVLAIDNVGLPRMLVGAIPLLLGQRPHIGGTRLYHLSRLSIHVDTPLDVSLDGEIAAHIPGEFLLVPNALRVVTGAAFVDK